MVMLIFLFLAIITSIATIFIKKQKNKETILITIISCLFLFNVWFWGILSFFAHTFMADKTAIGIGWPIWNPFQYEVAVTNLAFWILGIFCLWFRWNFWLATVIGYAVFLFWAAIIHIRDILLRDNMAEYNSWIILYVGDILLPLILLILVIFYLNLNKNKGK